MTITTPTRSTREVVRMPWFQVDDTLATHPKAREAGLAAMGLWAVAGAYAAQHLTEGNVPSWYVSSWPNGRKLAARLVAARLWEPTSDGWSFHQWDERQLNKSEVEAKRAANREKQRKHRERLRLVGAGDTSSPPSNPVTDQLPNQSRNEVSTPEGNGVSHDPLALPCPSLPTKALNLSNRGESPTSPRAIEDPPSEFCPAHPAGTEQACGACGTARRRRDEWDRTSAAEWQRAKDARIRANQDAAINADLQRGHDPDAFRRAKAEAEATLAARRLEQPPAIEPGDDLTAALDAAITRQQTRNGADA